MASETGGRAPRGGNTKQPEAGTPHDSGHGSPNSREVPGEEAECGKGT